MVGKGMSSIPLPIIPLTIWLRAQAARFVTFGGDHASERAGDFREHSSCGR